MKKLILIAGILLNNTSLCLSSGNDDTGTAPLYGLQSSNGSTIIKLGTQPAGSTNNEIVTGSGVIR